MKKDKAEYCKVKIGPGGRWCACCAPPSKILKKMEHKAARRGERKYVENELKAEEV